MAIDPLAKKMNAMVRDTEHYKRVVLSVQTFNSKRSFTDLCFVCARGHKVYAHKLLFCTVSSFLKEMFLEIQDNLQTLYVHLPDIESRMMELISDFLYEGSVKVSENEYANFQNTMDTLKIVLATKESNEESEDTRQTSQPVLQNYQQVPILQQQLQVPQQQMQPPLQQMQPSQGQLQSPPQAPQLVYMPTTTNAQGQLQYVLANPSQMNQVQVLQGMTQQNSGQMVQNGAHVLSSQVQQGNMMQMVQQNNTQMVPMSQLVAGGQMMRCSSQMVVQGNQQNLVTNNQLQVGMQAQVAQSSYTNNQPVQQQPQYVMASNTNNRTPTQYHRPQARARPALPATQIQQHSRINNVRARRSARPNVPMTQGRPTNRIIQRNRNMVQ